MTWDRGNSAFGDDDETVRMWNTRHNTNDALVDALYRALPFVEDALLDDCYKKREVQKVVKQIKEALKQAGAL